ncbi:MAG: hypothetical protein IKL24_04970 [Clostridia bacterium]|nr:hypothetical protein [Clostridia bacterium]
MFSENEKLRSTVISSLIGLGAFVVTATLLLVIFAALLTALEDPLKAIAPMGACSLCISSLTGGIVTTSLSKKTSTSLFSGAAALLTVLLLSLIPKAEWAPPILTLIFLAAVPLCFFCGGSISAYVISKKKRKSIRRRRS